MASYGHIIEQEQKGGAIFTIDGDRGIRGFWDFLSRGRWCGLQKKILRPVIFTRKKFLYILPTLGKAIIYMRIFTK
jgi:hypothetical protein